MPCDRRAQEVDTQGEEISIGIGRRKRSNQVGQVGEAEKIIPINHETAEIIARQEKLFRDQFGREPGPDDPLFFDPGVAAPQFLSDESTDERQPFPGLDSLGLSRYQRF